MIRGVWGLRCCGADPLVSLPDYLQSLWTMEPSSSSSLGNLPSPHHAQHLPQQGNCRTNGGSINSVLPGATPKKGSFGGVGSATQNLSSQHRILSPTVSIPFGTVGVNDTTPSYVPSNLSNDFPELADVGQGPASTLQTVTASLDGEQLGNSSKLDLKASPHLVKGTTPNVQNMKLQSQHRLWGSRQTPLVSGEVNKISRSATPAPSTSDIHFPPLNATSAAGNRESSRKGRGRGTAEQVQTHFPQESQTLKQAGEVDSRTSVQTVAEMERQRNINQNRLSLRNDRPKAGDRKESEFWNEQESAHGRYGRQNSPGRDPAWEKAQYIDTLGRALTRLLRHKAVEMNLEVRSDGYVDVQDILKLSMKTASNRPLTSHSIGDIKQAVQQDKKQRFGMKDENGRLFIRANQGHTMESVKSEHLLKPIVSVDEVPVCVHGTYHRYLALIFKEGLKRMQRNHVHFASGVPGSEDVISGMRSTCEVLIYLNVKKALADGMKLYISQNKVILTDGFGGVVPPEYFKEVLRLPDMKPIAPPPPSLGLPDDFF